MAVFYYLDEFLIKIITLFLFYPFLTLNPPKISIFSSLILFITPSPLKLPIFRYFLGSLFFFFNFIIKALVFLFTILYTRVVEQFIGGVAQLGARLTGSQKVRGSSPLISTNKKCIREPFRFSFFIGKNKK